MIEKNDNDENGEAAFDHVRKYGEIIVVRPPNSKYKDIELTGGDR